MRMDTLRVHAGRPVVTGTLRRLVLLIALLTLPAQAIAASSSTKVLLVGNSLSYVNNLPALFNALARLPPVAGTAQAELIAAPGGTIAERWDDGVVARELQSGRWQALVLQERGGLLACLGKPGAAESAECQASVRAHQNFARLGRQLGVRVVLLGTWGPDSIWQGQLSRGLRKLATLTGAEALDVGPLVRAYGKSHPETPMYSDAVLHPHMDASLLVAMALLQRLAGSLPAASDLVIEAMMPPANARPSAQSLMSSQPGLGVANAPTTIDKSRLGSLLSAAPTPP